MKPSKPMWLPIVTNVLMALLGAAGSLLVWLATSRYGVGVDPDSVAYLGTARNIAHGLGVISYGGNPMVFQPPLFPFILAVVDRILGVDPLLSARVINALILGLTVYVSGRLISRQWAQSPVYALLGTSWVLVSPALFGISVMAYTEPLFVVLAVLFLLCLQIWLERENRLCFAVLVLSAALACLTRYSGLTLVLAGGLAILLLGPQRLRARIVSALVFGCLSILPVSLWLVRNLDVSGTLFGVRSPAAYGLLEILKVAFTTLTSWYVPDAILASRAVLFLFALGIGFLAGFRLRGEEGRIRDRLPAIATLAPVLLFALIYLAFMILTSMVADVAPLGDRLLSPIYVPVTLLVLVLADQLLAPLGARIIPQFPRALASVIVVLWLLYPVRAIRSDIVTGLHEGWAYTGRVWKESPMIQYLQGEPLLASQTVYSNGPDVLYILLGLHARMSPAKTTYANGEIPVSSPIAGTLPQLGETWPGTGASCLVWFDNISDRHYLYPLNDLRGIAEVQQVRRFEDGTIYQVSSKP